MPINFNLEKYKNDVYIETGLFHGESLEKALSSGFKVCHSIEINPLYYNRGLEKFNTSNYQNISVIHLGSTLDILPKILEELDVTATFFLDAHDLTYPGIPDYPEEHSSPILKELLYIANHKIKDHTIIIDDLRMFEERSGWASNSDFSIEDIVTFLKKVNPNYEIIFESGYRENDVLVALPKKYKN